MRFFNLGKYALQTCINEVHYTGPALLGLKTAERKLRHLKHYLFNYFII